jgi:hypothetical protein
MYLFLPFPGNRYFGSGQTGPPPLHQKRLKFSVRVIIMKSEGGV